MPGESFGGPGEPAGGVLSPTRRIEISEEQETEATEPFIAELSLSEAERQRFERQKELVEKERLGEMHKQELLARHIKQDDEPQGKVGKFIRSFGIAVKSAAILGTSSLGLRPWENRQIRENLKAKAEYKVTDETELAVLRAEASNLKTSLDAVDQKTAEQYNQLTNRKLADKLLNSEGWSAQRAGAALAGGAVLLKMPFMSGMRRALNSVLGASGAGLLVGGTLGALRERAAEFERQNNAASIIGQYEEIKNSQGREAALGVLKQSLEHGQASFKRSEILKIAAKYRTEMREEVVDKMAAEPGLEAVSSPEERQAVVNQKFIELQKSLAGDENDLTRVVVERLGEGEAVKNLYEALSNEKNKKLKQAMVKGALMGGTFGAIAGAAMSGVREYLREHGGQMLDSVIGAKHAEAATLKAGELPTGGSSPFGSGPVAPAYRADLGDISGSSSSAAGEIHSALTAGHLPNTGIGSDGTGGYGSSGLNPADPSGHEGLIPSHAPTAEATYGRGDLMPSHTSGGEVVHGNLLPSHGPLAETAVYSNESAAGGHGPLEASASEYGHGELTPSHEPTSVYGHGALEHAPIGKTYTVYDVYDNNRADKYFEDVITKSDPLVGKGLQTNYGSAMAQVVHDNAGHFGLDPVKDRELLHILKTMNAPVDSRYASIDPSHSIAINPEIAGLADPSHRLPDGVLHDQIVGLGKNPENYQYQFNEKEIQATLEHAKEIQRFMALRKAIPKAITERPDLLAPPYVSEDWVAKNAALLALVGAAGVLTLAGMSYAKDREIRRLRAGGATTRTAPGPVPAPGPTPPVPGPTPPGPPTPEALRTPEAWTLPENSIYRITPERAGGEPGTAAHIRSLLATAYPPTTPPPAPGWRPFRAAPPPAPTPPTPEQQAQARQDLRLIANEAAAGDHVFEVQDGTNVPFARLTNYDETSGQLTFTRVDGSVILINPDQAERVQTTRELPSLTAARLQSGLNLTDGDPNSLRSFLPQIQNERIPIIINSGAMQRSAIITGISNVAGSGPRLTLDYLGADGAAIGTPFTLDTFTPAEVATIVGVGQASRFERTLGSGRLDVANIFRNLEDALAEPAGALRESLAAVQALQQSRTLIRANVRGVLNPGPPPSWSYQSAPAMIEGIQLLDTAGNPVANMDLSNVGRVAVRLRAVNQAGQMVNAGTPAPCPGTRELVIEPGRGWDRVDAAGNRIVDAGARIPEAGTDLQAFLTRVTAGPRRYATPEGLAIKNLVTEFDRNPTYISVRSGTGGEKVLCRAISFDGQTLRLRQVNPVVSPAPTGTFDLQNEDERKQILNILPASVR